MTALHMVDDPLSLPPHAVTFATLLLPLYQVHRSQWPLWTFDRGTWRRSAAPLFQASQFSPGAVMARRRAEDSLQEAELLQALTRAAMARQIPPDLAELPTYPTPADVLAWDDDLISIVQDRLPGVLMRFHPDFRDLWLEQALPEEERDLQGAPVDPQQLAIDFCTELGLMLVSKGGARIRLSGWLVDKLVKEGTEIARGVTDFSPSEEVELAVEKVLLTGGSDYEIERLRQPNIRKNLLRKHALKCCFPFLLGSELEHLDRTSGGPVMAAQELVASRLPGNIKPGSIRTKRRPSR